MMMAALKVESCFKAFGGFQKVFSHQSEELKCSMKYGAFIPNHKTEEKVPMLFYLSGLTCTEQNFVTKSGFHKYATDHRVIVIAPDTSPRGCNIEGEDDSYDFGSGAGFYLDATEEKWKKNYRMYSYITKELLPLVKTQFQDIFNGNVSIMGHSMGGHGALICALKNPGMFASVSAFAPICNPMKCPWGQKAFKGYLGDDESKWKEYDACELIKKYDGPILELHVDQGTADQFYKDGQLLPENLAKEAQKVNMPFTLSLQDGYDHSYYFIASFMEDHFKFHAERLRK